MAEVVERLLKLFPGLLAGGLALVYVLGAVVTGSEFAGSGIDPGVAVPLLSIEQLLARGVGILVKPTAILFALEFVVILVQGVALHFFQQRVESREDGSKSSGRVRKRLLSKRQKELRKRVLLLLGFGMCIVLFLFVPVDQLLGSIFILGGFWIALTIYLLEPGVAKRWRPLFVLALVASFVIGLGIIAYTDPNPLANARLELKSGDESPEGTFVSHSHSTWYLYNENLGQIEAFPDEAIDTAFVEKRASGDSNDGKSLGSYFWDEL